MASVAQEELSNLLSEYSCAALISEMADAALVQPHGHDLRTAACVPSVFTDHEPINERQERIRTDIFVTDNLP